VPNKVPKKIEMDSLLNLQSVMLMKQRLLRMKSHQRVHRVAFVLLVGVNKLEWLSVHYEKGLHEVSSSFSLPGTVYML